AASLRGADVLDDRAAALVDRDLKIAVGEVVRIHRVRETPIKNIAFDACFIVVAGFRSVGVRSSAMRRRVHAKERDVSAVGIRYPKGVDPTRFPALAVLSVPDILV